MAKRKRLTPPDPAQMVDHTAPEPATHAPFQSAPDGGASVRLMPGPRPSAPIADVARDSSTAAALDEVTATLTRAREEGRMVLPLPLAAIELDHLVRDRIVVDDEEMDALVESLRIRGQQTPIEVADLGNERYGLISGWRRCRALQKLRDETGEESYATVLALLRRPDQASDAYLAMVEENEIRVGLSYYERARIAAKSVEQGVFESEKAALQQLFRSASRAKRSKIGAFLSIVHALDGVLKFPEALSERGGLTLARALEDQPELGGQLRGALMTAAPADPEAEQAVLMTTFATEDASARPPADPIRKAGPEPRKPTSAPGGASEPLPGVRVETGRDGSLKISGSGLDETLRAALIEWLKARGEG